MEKFLKFNTLKCEKASDTDELALFAIIIQAASKAERRRFYDGFSICKTMLGTIEWLEREWGGCEMLSLFKAQRESQRLDELRLWREGGISYVLLGQEEYPSALSEIFEPPPILFYRGRLPCWRETPQLAVIGSRSADKVGSELAREFSRGLAEAGVTVVSGLAMGIDSAAHRGALTGYAVPSTIAVLGSGLLHLYPATNRALAEQILDSGGIIMSQFAPDQRPYPVNFLNRNRVIAGLSSGVLVIQAAKQSGSLVTARYALEEGRDVMVLPGSVTDPRYYGSNQLIRQGAALITTLEELFDFLPGLKRRTAVASSVSSVKQDEIVSILASEEKLDINLLQARLKEKNCLDQRLLELELNGVIIRLPGNIIALKPTAQDERAFDKHINY